MCLSRPKKKEEEGKRMVQYLTTKLITYLIKATKWSNFETSKQLFWYIPLPTQIKEINDTSVNEYFALNKTEVDVIMV